jgi:NTE family protein
VAMIPDVFIKASKHFWVIGIALTIVGCKHYPINERLAKRDTDKGYYFHLQPRPNNSDELLVILAFSGGGTRAAAFSYGVLEALREQTITIDGEERSLLNEVDAISSVSGGSVTAAAYGLYGEKTFDILEDAFLKRNVQGALAWRVLNPLHWPGLWSSTWSRSDLAAEYYDEILFHGATFADLQRKEGPFIIINSTDASEGGRFNFTQYIFDVLCSDLSNYPVSRAVAASSAVPGLLTPITLNNYGGTCDYTGDEWISRLDAEYNGRLQLRAHELASMGNSTNRPYLHLVDGGVADNLGLRPLMDTMSVIEQSPDLVAGLKTRNVKKIVVISANAYSSPAKDWDSKPSPPGSIALAAAAAAHTLDRYSIETLQLFRDEFERWQGKLGVDTEIKLYPIMLSFTKFKDTQQKNFFLSLPTSFFLQSTQIDKLREAGHTLLYDNDDYKKLLTDLGKDLGPLAAN